MANIFTLENIQDFSEKINIDELYEKKKKHDLNKLELFNKILNRIHVRIKTTSRQKIDDQYCWFVVPEIIIGVPKYDQGACIAYLLDKLKTNGFNVRYIHPNTLLISWHHWVPSYVRSELKKKTGIIVDEYGNKINENDDNNDFSEKLKFDNQQFVNEKIFNNPMNITTNTKNINQNNQKKYTPINSYKPSGSLVYNQDLLDKLENKFS
jgi:hypothetical protein